MSQEDFSIQSAKTGPAGYMPLDFTVSRVSQSNHITNPVPTTTNIASNLPSPDTPREAQDLQEIKANMNLIDIARQYYGGNQFNDSANYASAYTKGISHQGLYHKIKAQSFNEGTPGSHRKESPANMPPRSVETDLTPHDYVLLNKLNQYAILPQEEGSFRIFTVNEKGEQRAATSQDLKELKQLSAELGDLSIANDPKHPENRQKIQELQSILTQVVEVSEQGLVKNAPARQGISPESIEKSIVLGPTVGGISKATNNESDMGLINWNKFSGLKVLHDGFKANPIAAKQYGGGFLIALGGILFTKLLTSNAIGAVAAGAIPAALGMYFIKDGVKQSQTPFSAGISF